MANQIIIDIGAVANDGTGDPLRTAFNYVNNNFSNVWNTGLPTSNIQFNDNRIVTTTTNGNLILAPNGTGKVVANVDVLPNISNIRNLGSLTRRWSTVYSQYLNVTGEVDFAGDVIVGGNLTVEGDTIQLGNITTDSKTIQLSNTAVTANAANGSGVTVGAADDIATMLYNSAGNVWNFNIGLSAVGNVTAPYFIGNGSQLTGLITVGGSNTQIQYNDNGVLAGDAGLTYNAANNTIQVSGIANTGEHAAIFGASGYTELNANVVVQITANANSYTQINFQNINDGSQATTDYIATASSGTDSTYFVDMGIASNSYDSANIYNSLGNSLYPQDSYLYSMGGNSYGGSGGNLVVGSNEPGGVVRIIADGSGLDNVVATLSNVGIDVKGNILPVVDSQYDLGNSTNKWSNIWATALNAADGNNVWTISGANINAPSGGRWESNLSTEDDYITSAANGYINLQSLFADGNIASELHLEHGVAQIRVADAPWADWYFRNTGTMEVPGDIIPQANGVYSLGNATNYWSNLWVANNTIYIGGVPLGISAGNVLTVGGEPLLSNDSNTSIATTGNITADYFLGNGSQLTGLPVPYSDSNVATFLSSFGSNTISTTGNVTANFVAPGANGQIMYNDSGLIGGSTAFTFDENGNTLTIGTTGGTLKVADIQTPQAGVSLRLIPASGITYSYGNLLPLFANTYDTGGASNRWQTVFANVANLVTASISGAVTASSITLSSTGTAVNASSGNMLTNQVTGTQLNFLNGLYTVNLNAGQATANYALRLPANAGANGQTLTTDGTGNLSWSTPASTYGNSNVATFLASYGSNTISTTGNITAGNLIGNISITGNVTGTSANVDIIAGSYQWTFNNTGNLVLPGNTFTVNYANGTAVTLGGSYGNANVADFLDSLGSNAIVTTGNVTAGNLITSGAATTGVNALLAGPTFTPLANTSAGFVANVNSYSQITFQNKNAGADATADYILTADNGSDTVNYGDFGIINSGYDVNTPTNSLGNIVRAGDTYIYAQGNVSNTSQSGGNLIIGTTVPTKNVKIFAGGANNNALIANISNTGMVVTGNVTATNFIGNVSLTGNIQGTSANVELVAGSYTWTFDNTGIVTLPAVGGDEGGEINFAIPTANTTLTSPVKVDVYQDRIRFFDGSTKGAYIDLSQTAAGVATLLNNRVSGYVNAGTYVTMDNLKATVSTAGNRSLQIATVSGSFSAYVNASYAVFSGGTGGTGATLTVTTTPALAIAWNFTGQGDTATYIINDTTNSRCYRVTMMIGGSYNNNFISIERLI